VVCADAGHLHSAGCAAALYACTSVIIVVARLETMPQKWRYVCCQMRLWGSLGWSQMHQAGQQISSLVSCRDQHRIVRRDRIGLKMFGCAAEVTCVPSSVTS
jgi:hypothetical protein